ncbi:hypothetical protein BOX15_Mlig000131g3, partial [Macrostomum lignano]
LVALTHFCEDHGPSVVMCTQAVRLSGLPVAKGGSCLDGATISSALPGGPASLTSTKCPACRSMPPNTLAMYTADWQGDLLLVSSQHPAAPNQLYSQLRQACLRVHSCEVCPTGAMYFGDDAGGGGGGGGCHVFASPFQLDDVKARGLSSQFSVLALSRDGRMLLQSWPWLVNRSAEIIAGLRDAAAAQFSAEQSAGCSARAARINGSGWVRMRRSDVPTRSLAQLTSDPSVYRRLHTCFARLLRGWQREELAPGRPTEDQLALDSVLCLAEEDEDSADDGIRTVVPTPTKLVGGGGGGGSSGLGGEGVQLPVVSAVFHSLRHLRERLHQAPPACQSIDNFSLLLHHLLTGNQIVFRTSLPELAKSFFTLLRCLLPSNCSQELLNWQRYEEPYRCNLLGLTADTRLPDWIAADGEGHPMLLLDCRPDASALAAQAFIPVDDLDLVVTTNRPARPAAQLIGQIDSLLGDPVLPEESLDLLLANAKEDWLERARQTYAFMQAHRRQFSDGQVTAFLSSLGCQRADEIVLKFWTRGISGLTRREIIKSCRQ